MKRYESLRVKNGVASLEIEGSIRTHEKWGNCRVRFWVDL